MVYLPVDGGDPLFVELCHHRPFFGTSVDPLNILYRVPDHVPPVVAAVGVEQEFFIGRNIGAERDVDESRSKPAQTFRKSLKVTVNKRAIIYTVYINHDIKVMTSLL